MTATIAAIERSTSWHMTGHVTSSGISFKLDLSFDGNARVGGVFTLPDNTQFDLVTLGGDGYMRGSDAVWKHLFGGSAASALHGKWLEFPLTNRELLGFTQFTDPESFLTSVLGLPDLANKGETTYGGKQVVELSSPGHATLYVAATGPANTVAVVLHYPGVSGTLMFDRWNAPVSIPTPPATDVLDLSTLGKTST